MKISFINESLESYGAAETTTHYENEARKRGYEVVHNIVDRSIDFYVLGMFFGPMQNRLKEFIKPKKFVFVEHSIELLQPYNQWLREWVMPNSYKNYFFSPRSREHCENGLPTKDKHLCQKNIGYLVVPVDYDFWKPDPTLKRKENLNLFVGMMTTNKGIIQVVNLAKRKLDQQFWFIGTTTGGDYDINKLLEFSNIKYLGHKSKEELRKYYSEAKNLYLMPMNGAVESAGRVIWESILCGCSPITNNDVGNCSYKWWRDKNEIIKQMDISTNNLFETIEKGINEC